MDTSIHKTSIHKRSELDKFKLFYEYPVTNQEERKRLKIRTPR